MSTSYAVGALGIVLGAVRNVASHICDDTWNFLLYFSFLIFTCTEWHKNLTHASLVYRFFLIFYFYLWNSRSLLAIDFKILWSWHKNYFRKMTMKVCDSKKGLMKESKQDFLHRQDTIISVWSCLVRVGEERYLFLPSSTFLDYLSGRRDDLLVPGNNKYTISHSFGRI